MKIIAIAITMMLLGMNGFGGDISPSNLLEKVVSAYKSMETYKDEGTVALDMDAGGMKMNTETTFSILLKKPNLYLISWTQKNMPMPGMVQSGAVWSDGTQPYLYMGMMKAYSKMTSDEIALSGATGISGGCANTIPSLFLGVLAEKPSPFARLHTPKIERVEKIDGDDCYVLSSPSVISKKETFWISKATCLIRKYSWSLESPAKKRRIPKMTDEQLEAAIKGMGQDVTEESKNRMREMMEKSEETLNTLKMKGVSIQVHSNISSPELDRADFKFALPEGTVLKKSLFGGMFNQTNSIPHTKPVGNVSRELNHQP